MSSSTTAPSGDDIQPSITVHWLDLSRAQRILWLLEEIGLPYKTVVYRRQADATAPPSAKLIHPLGKLPMLEIDGQIYAESALITDILVEKFGTWMQPDRKDEKAWFEYRYWLHYVEASLLFPMLTGLLLKIGEGEVRDKLETGWLRNSYATHLGFVENHLRDKTYLCGEQFTGADILMSYPLAELAMMVVPEYSREAYPSIFAYADRLVGREAYQRALKKMEGNEKTTMEAWLKGSNHA